MDLLSALLEASSAWGRAVSFDALLAELPRMSSVLGFERCAIVLDAAGDRRARAFLVDRSGARAVEPDALPRDNDALALPLQSASRPLGEIRFTACHQPQLAQFVAETLCRVVDCLLARESEEKYRTLIESIDEGVALCEVVRGADGGAAGCRVLELNAAFAEHTGFDSSWLNEYAQAVDRGEPAHFERWFPQSERWYAISVYPRGGERFAIVFLEITEQKHAESELQWREALLTAQKEAFQAAVNGAPLDVSLGLLLRTAIAQSGGELRCAFYIADDSHTTLRHVAGMSEAYAQCVDGFRISADSLACGLAAYSQQPVITPDVAEDPRWREWLWLAEEYGYRACWSFPLQALSGNLIGTLAMYFRSPRQATARDYEFAEVMTRAAAIIIAREHVEQALRDNRGKLARQLDDAEHLQRASSFLIEDQNPERAYEMILDAAMAMTKADVGSIQILDRDGQHLRLVASRDMHPESSGIVSVQSTPLKTRDGRLVGMLSTHWRRAHSPDEHELRMIDVLARQAADVFERRHVLDELRDREERLRSLNDALEVRVRERTAEIGALLARLLDVQEKERGRIARNIHDELGQQMTALRVNLDALRATARGNEPLMQQAERATRLAEELDRSVDFLTWELRPAALDHLGLSAALAQLTSGWSRRFGIEADYEAVGVDGSRFAPEVEANLYRLTQEALHNVYKHARATRVSVVLKMHGDRLALVVDDDGRGFAETAYDRSTTESFGLLTMRERAALAGGELTIESTPGHGTTLIVRVPLASRTHTLAPLAGRGWPKAG